MQACMTALENHLKPKPDVVYEQYIFNSCEQNSGESVDSFVTRLRKYASSCGFGLLDDKLILDRLAISLLEKGTKRKLLREKSLTPDKALDIAHSDQ